MTVEFCNVADGVPWTPVRYTVYFAHTDWQARNKDSIKP